MMFGGWFSGGGSMEGTATISLKTLDELRAKVKEAEQAKKWSEQFTKKLMDCYGFNAEECDKALEELKELIQEYIDEEASDEHLDIAKASLKELKQIQVVLKE